MSSSTIFTGTIHISPRVEDGLAERLNKFFRIRHMRRSVAALERMYPSKEARASHTLFGDGEFGEEGMWYLPEQTKGSDFVLSEPIPEGLEGMESVNIPPRGLPDLYCRLELIQDDENNSSILRWNGAEKAYYISEWLSFLADVFKNKGYALNGTIHADVDEGCHQYDIVVSENEVQVFEKQVKGAINMKKYIFNLVVINPSVDLSEYDRACVLSFQTDTLGEENEQCARDAVADYLSTEDGKAYLNSNGGFCWSDAVMIPRDVWERHGLTPVIPCKLDLAVDATEILREGNE